jgi:peptidoglycan/LPS O-acetylase OafA/YrhL
VATAPAPEHPPAHLPALDGVRGLAILLVIWFHQTIYFQPAAGPDLIYKRLARMGWCGVDLFFVLSGFLITGILLDARDRAARPGRYFGHFYARRTLRIFPLYYAVLVGLILVLPLLAQLVGGGLAFASAEQDSLRAHQAWYWLYVSNFFAARHGWLENGVADVLWSLSIEEQFYLVWPAVVWFAGRRRLVWICLGLIALAPATRLALVAWGARPIVAYVVTPARVDTLAIGALLAALVRSGPDALAQLVRLARPVLACTGAAIALLVLWRAFLMAEPGQVVMIDYDPVMLTVGLSLLAVFFGALLVVVVGADASAPLARVFRAAPLRFFGVYSYAIYLFHLGVQALLMRGLGPLEARVPQLAGSALPAQAVFHVVTTGACVAVALASWHLWEKHWLALKRYFA